MWFWFRQYLAAAEPIWKLGKFVTFGWPKCSSDGTKEEATECIKVAKLISLRLRPLLLSLPLSLCLVRIVLLFYRHELPSRVRGRRKIGFVPINTNVTWVEYRKQWWKESHCISSMFEMNHCSVPKTCVIEPDNNIFGEHVDVFFFWNSLQSFGQIEFLFFSFTSVGLSIHQIQTQTNQNHTNKEAIWMFESWDSIFHT